MTFARPQGMALVEWTDHAFHTGEWDGDEALPTMAYRSVGWLLPDRDDGITRLAQSWDVKSDQYSDILSLDPRSVEHVTMLRKSGSKKGGPDQAEAQPDPPGSRTPFLGDAAS